MLWEALDDECLRPKWWHMAHEQCHKEADNYIIYLTQTVLNIKNCNVFLKWDFAGIVLLHKQDLEIMSNRDAD